MTAAIDLSLLAFIFLGHASFMFGTLSPFAEYCFSHCTFHNSVTLLFQMSVSFLKLKSINIVEMPGIMNLFVFLIYVLTT